jgi:SAM-dependent methyltransferase
MPGAATPYDPIAALYDLEHAAFADDIPLMRNIAEIVGDPIVELGCGSGRVLLPIAADGFAVTGVDTSQPMLDELKRRAAEIDGGRITTVNADMRGPLPLPSDTFGIAIFSLNGLLHLETQADQIVALTEAARVLDPRGQLVIDIFHPTPDYLTHIAGGPHLEGAWSRHDGREIEKWSHRRVNPASQAIETRLWYDAVRDDGTVERIRTSFALRYIHAAELELMLHRAGFVEWKLYGTYDLDPLEDGSDRIIAMAELTPSG